LEFEAQLNPDKFIDRMNAIERLFEYKDVSDDEKVKLIALNYVSMPPFGGVIFYLRGLKMIREILGHGER